MAGECQNDQVQNGENTSEVNDKIKYLKFHKIYLIQIDHYTMDSIGEKDQVNEAQIANNDIEV